MKKILILGSGGQIGGHLVDFFKLKKEYEILEFDILSGKTFDLRNFNNKNIEKYIKKSDFIFFLAFDVGGSRYLKKYQKTYNFLMNNLLIMSNVFQLIKKHKKKFIFASSQMSNMDFSPYGTLKRLGEEITKSLNGIYVKFWNVYGIEKDEDKSHVITDFILMAFKKKKIKMLTDGNESREFLYATDCSFGLFISLGSPQRCISTLSSSFSPSGVSSKARFSMLIRRLVSLLSSSLALVFISLTSAFFSPTSVRSRSNSAIFPLARAAPTDLLALF